MNAPATNPDQDTRRLVALITDEGTGLLSDAYFRLRLEEEFKKSWRFRWTFSLLVIEVDLPAQGSASSPAALDRIMLEVAGEVLTASRDVDLSARLGPRRFAMLLPGTPAEGARTMVQRVMVSVLDRLRDQVSLSVGLTEAPQDKLSSADEFLARAETALRTARGQGANQIATWNSPSH
ncbi:MAG: GGDEF domain-containing protein [Planctomycetota bacterium]